MKVNNSMNRKNDVLINDGKPRNKKEKKQLRENAKKIGNNKFDPIIHKMIKHPTIKGAMIQVLRTDKRN